MVLRHFGLHLNGDALRFLPVIPKTSPSMPNLRSSHPLQMSSPVMVTAATLGN